jgi:hypothetical protein
MTYDIDLIILLTIVKSSAFSDRRSKEIPGWLVFSTDQKNKMTTKFFKNISKILTKKQPTSTVVLTPST